MRLMRVISFIVTLLIFSAGCNGDVFIEKLEASQTEFEVPSLGGQFKIELTHGDWNVERIAVNRVDVDGIIREESCEEVRGPLRLNGYGQADFTGSLTSFNVSRAKDEEVIMTFGPSKSIAEVQIDLYLSNDYQEVVVSFVQEHCTGYRFDRIEYGAITEHSNNQYEDGWTEEFYNDSQAYLFKKVSVFNDDVVRIVSFPANTVHSYDIDIENWPDQIMKYVGEPFDVPVPDPCLDGKELTFSGQTVRYSWDDVYIPVVLPHTTREFVVSPMETVLLDMRWGYTEYVVDYTIWMCHDNGGQPFSFSGSVRSKTHDGRWTSSITRGE